MHIEVEKMDTVFQTIFQEMQEKLNHGFGFS